MRMNDKTDELLGNIAADIKAMASRPDKTINFTADPSNGLRVEALGALTGVVQTQVRGGLVYAELLV